MRIRKNSMWAAALALVALLAGSSSAVIASDEAGDTEVHVKRVHKVVLNCEEGSDEDCEREIRIKTLGDGSHAMHVGDHEMVWVEGGEDGAHYSFGTAFAGQGGFLGVQLTDLTPELRTHFGVATDEGVMVAKVVDDSAAFRAGLAAGDIITRIDGKTVRSSGDLTHAIRSREEGETVSLEIWRDGSLEAISATLDKNEQMSAFRRHVMIDCEDDEGDCGAVFVGQSHHGMTVECPDGEEECEVKIDCDDGSCECTVNGNSIDCEELHTGHGFQD